MKTKTKEDVIFFLFNATFVSETNNNYLRMKCYLFFKIQVGEKLMLTKHS